MLGAARPSFSGFQPLTFCPPPPLIFLRVSLNSKIIAAKTAQVYASFNKKSRDYNENLCDGYSSKRGKTHTQQLEPLRTALPFWHKLLASREEMCPRTSGAVLEGLTEKVRELRGREGLRFPALPIFLLFEGKVLLRLQIYSMCICRTPEAETKVIFLCAYTFVSCLISSLVRQRSA